MATSGSSGIALQPTTHSRGWLLGVDVVALALGMAGLIMTFAFTVAGVLWYGAVQVTEAVMPSGTRER
jgi:hypothetical protein